MDGGIKFIRGSYQNVKHIISSFFQFNIKKVLAWISSDYFESLEEKTTRSNRMNFRLRRFIIARILMRFLEGRNRVNR